MEGGLGGSCGRIQGKETDPEEHQCWWNISEVEAASGRPERGEGTE